MSDPRYSDVHAHDALNTALEREQEHRELDRRDRERRARWHDHHPDAVDLELAAQRLGPGVDRPSDRERREYRRARRERERQERHARAAVRPLASGVHVLTTPNEDAPAEISGEGVKPAA